MLGDEMDDVVRDGKLQTVQLCLLLEDGNSMLEIRQTDISHHAALESADEPGFEARYFRWWSVALISDLAAGLIERVNSVEELFLSRFFAIQKVMHESHLE